MIIAHHRAHDTCQYFYFLYRAHDWTRIADGSAGEKEMEFLL